MVNFFATSDSKLTDNFDAVSDDETKKPSLSGWETFE